jgi:glycogen operon protein
MFVNGEAIAMPGPRGERVTDASFYLIANAHHEAIDFRLPLVDWGARWVTVLDTREARPPDEEGRGEPIPAGGIVRAEAWSMALLKRIE